MVEYLQVFGHVGFFAPGDATVRNRVGVNVFHGGFGMLVLSRTTQELVAGGECGVHRPRRMSLLDAEAKDLAARFEDNAEVPVQQLEMLERIRVAAGQTS